MFIFCITTHFPLCIKSVWTSPLSSLSSLVHAFVGSPKNTARFKNKKKTKTISGEVHRGFWICERTLRDLEAIFWASSSLFNLECENGACFLCLEKNVQRYWWMLLNEDLTSSVWRRPVVRLPTDTEWWWRRFLRDTWVTGTWGHRLKPAGDANDFYVRAPSSWCRFEEHRCK